MKYFFTLALLNAAAMAKHKFTHEEENGFLRLVATYGNNYATVQQVEKAIITCNENKETVSRLNKNSQGVVYRLNSTFDMTREEFAKANNLRVPKDLKVEFNRDLSEDDEGGRRLSNARSLDWAAAEKMTPVKHQGACGSCWAFAAASVQEGMQAIQYKKAPVRLSEQEGVDCVDRSFGCNGGWMSHYWEWTRQGNPTNPGAQAYDTYREYKAKQGACELQDNQKISKAYDWGRINSLPEIIEKLNQGPLSIAVEASSRCFQWYSGGVMTEAELKRNNCIEYQIDHGVALVGVHFAGDEGNAAKDDDNGNNDGDNDNNDNGDEDMDPDMEEVCRKSKGRERKKTGCDGRSGYEEYFRDHPKNGKPKRRCCHMKPIEPVETEGFRLVNQGMNEGVNDEEREDYFVIQNSWGQTWGINGYMKVKIENTEEGKGNFGMYKFVEWMAVQ